MFLPKYLLISSLLVAVTTAGPVEAKGTLIRNSSAFKATDFHIVFMNNIDKAAVSSANFANVSYGSNNSELNFTGDQGVNGGQSGTFNGFGYGTTGHLPQGADAIVSWNWTPTGPNSPGATDPQIQYTDPTTGQTSYVTLAQLAALGDTAYALPEAAAWILMILGFGVVGAAARGRRSSLTA